MENERKHEKFVADKCIFDYHIYADSLNMHDAVIETTQLIALQTHGYDHIFYIKPEFAIEDDWLRSLNKEFQDQVDQRYHDFLHKHNLPFQQLTGSIKERLNQAVEYINRQE